MGVIVSKRKINDMSFYSTGCELRIEITKMLEQIFSEGLPCSPALALYLHTKILDTMGKMMDAIERGNEIYPTSMEDVIKRQALQHDALGYLGILETDLHYLANLFNKQIRHMVKISDNIQKERALLRSWKQRNNKYKKQFRREGV